MAPFLLAFLLSQDQSAEAAYRAIEETLQKAERVTVSCRGEYQVWSGEQHGKSEGSSIFLVEERNKILIQHPATTSAGDQATVDLFVSDGENVHMRVDSLSRYDANRGLVKDPRRRWARAAPDLAQRVISAWVLHGDLGPSSVIEVAVAPPGSPERNLESKDHRSAALAGPDDGAAKTLTYDVGPEGNAGPSVKHKIWYDSKTLRILKRSISYQDDRKEYRFHYVETYEELRPAKAAVGEKFQVPERTPEEKLAGCAENLRALWALQTLYASQFGGRTRALPAETGSAFWLALTRTSPPVLQERDLSLLVCPFAGRKPSPDTTTYRGPKTGIAPLVGEDAVGCCEPGSHPDGTVTVLQKNGKATTVGPNDPLYKRALETTTLESAPPKKK